MGSPEIRLRSWVRGTPDDERGGLLGFLCIEFGPWVFDGITLRKTAGGRFALSFPSRTDRAGRRHSYFRPCDDEARRAIEREIFAQLGQREDSASRRRARDE